MTRLVETQLYKVRHRVTVWVVEAEKGKVTVLLAMQNLEEAAGLLLTQELVNQVVMAAFLYLVQAVAEEQVEALAEMAQQVAQAVRGVGTLRFLGEDI